MERILQFGEGNFLRAFAEEYIEQSGFGEVVITQPRTNTKVINAMNNRNCEYDLIFRGRLNGNVIDERKKITCVSRCIDSVSEIDKLEEVFCSDELEIVISNTTEAGIRYIEGDHGTFPAKLAKLLGKREKAGKKPLVFLPVELIQNNGDELKRCIISYAKDFELSTEYIDSCSFCNTLVDRIVTGHNTDDADPCSVVCEPYRSFVIEAGPEMRKKLPDWDVTYTSDISLYRTRKVRILNGAHTMSVAAALMCGIEIVRDMMNDDMFSEYIDLGLEEIKQTIDMPKEELNEFADAVKERFNNPFIDHKLRDISLNSVSKYTARILDTVSDYHRINGKYPVILSFALSALIALYKAENPNDDKAAIEYIKSNDVLAILKNANLWGRDISGMYETVNRYYEYIQENGMRNAVSEVVNEAKENK